jgi:hypothetical protein
MARLLLSRSSFDDATEVEAGQSAPVPLSPNCFPRSQSDQRIPHQTTGAIGCLISCAHGINSMRYWARIVPLSCPSSQRASMDTRFQTCAFWPPRGLLSMCLGEVILGCFACPLPRPCSPKSVDLRGHRRPRFWRTCIMDVGCSTAILDLEQIAPVWD